MEDKVFYSYYNSDVGPILIAVSDKGVLRVSFENKDIFISELKKANKNFVLEESDERVFYVKKQLDDYFRGRLKRFDLPLDIAGTPFMLKVWSALLEIPYGETMSYKEIAEKIGKPKAFRAVGNANGKNPISNIIPCQRVIAHDGTLGGYGGGLKIKKYLLNLEKKYR